MIEKDKVVAIEYELKDNETKEVLDSNKGGKALEFLYGRGQIISGLENELGKMKQGDQKEILVKAEEAYGKYNEDAKQTLPREQFAGIELSEGMTLYGQGEDGQTVQVIVKGFDDDNVKVDFNHPLAGKDLLFDVKVIETRDATEDELVSGVVGGAHSCCGGHGGCGDHDHEHGECCGGEHKHGEGCSGEHKHKHGEGCCGGH